MSIKRITLLILGAAFILSVFQGCRLPLKPIPGPGRNGRFYCYTEDYPDRHFPFCLLGKSLTASKGDGSWEFLPPPTAIFPGYPLFWLERYIVCPVVDTVMIPYDLYLRKRNANVCARDGYYVRIIDYAGQAVQDVDIEVIVDKELNFNMADITDGQEDLPVNGSKPEEKHRDWQHSTFVQRSYKRTHQLFKVITQLIKETDNE